MVQELTEGPSAQEVKEALDMAGKILNTPQSDTFMSNDQKLGVLQTLIHAVMKDADYQFRQVLLTAAFDDKKEGLLAADAISERLRYGVDIAPLITRITAQCGVKGQRVDKILEALTHYTFSTNYQNNQKKGQSNASHRTPL